MLLTSDTAASTTFMGTFDSYISKALPALMEFKAPGYFKVKACNTAGCSAMSTVSDAGRAQYIHTSASSDVAQVLAPIVVYPVVRALAAAPRGQAALGWCGMDLCGNISGMVMGRIDITGVFTGTLPQIDVHYENYEVGSSANANASLLLDGYIGGMQSAADAQSGILTVSGDMDFELPGGLAGTVFAWIKIDAVAQKNTGYFTVTYNGSAYKFTLPVHPTNGQVTGLAAAMASAASASYTPVSTRTTTYPTPFFTTAPASGCGTNETTVVKNCTRVQ
jgi:hypothetical protein